MMDYRLLLDLLRAEVLPTMGFTESGAVALAAAQASEVLGGKISGIEVIVNANIYKNGIAVGIPGTGETGLEIAAALGTIKKHPENQLSVLSDVTEDELLRSHVMLFNGVVKVAVDDTKNNLWVQVRMTSGSEWSQVIIRDQPTNIVSIQKNGVYLLNREQIKNQEIVDVRAILRDTNVTVNQIIKTVESMPDGELDFLLEGIEMNLHAANLGISKKLGMGIGAGFEKMMHSGLLSDDMVNYAKRLTAAAADARMSGENVTIMSSAGSGNYGITAILPVYAVARRINSPQKRLVRAIGISHLITSYINIYTGSLSALCSCGVTAAESSLLAQQGIAVPDTNGIITETMEGTIKNLGKVSNPGMLQTDKIIMEVMLDNVKENMVS